MKKRSKKYRKRTKKSLLLILIIFLITTALIIGLLYNNPNKNNKNNNESKNELVNKEPLTEYVITKDNISLYKKDNDEYKEIGTISSDVILNIDINGEFYYQVKNLDQEYYIKNENLSNYKETITIDDRYKNYIIFNQNITTEDKTNFYDENDNLIYSINESFSLPIIIKETDKYGVEIGNRLLYIKKEDGTVIESSNTEEKNISGIATLNYHAFYDDDNEEERANCTTEICHSDTQFKTHLDLIKENNILTLKMKEVEMYIDGKIQLPKSVLITIDDGGKTQIAVDMLTEYQMYATIFMVTSWFDPTNYYITEYIELHSHSHDMHNPGDCPNGQGGGIQCLDKEVIQEDLKTSSELLNGSTYFCYPFYEYNNYSIEMLKEAGYTMAFVGESSRSDNLTKVGSNKFKLPRFVIVTYTTLNDLERYFNGMK